MHWVSVKDQRPQVVSSKGGWMGWCSDADSLANTNTNKPLLAKEKKIVLHQLKLMEQKILKKEI